MWPAQPNRAKSICPTTEPIIIMTFTALNTLAEQALSRDPATPAIEFSRQWYTWGDLKQVADSVAALVAASGAEDNAVIALVAKNRPSAIAAYLGLLRDRRNIRIVYPFQSAAAIAADIASIKPALVIAAEETLETALLDTLRDLRIAAVSLGDKSARAVEGLEQSAIQASTCAAPQLEILTSGTTGAPKPFALSYDTIAEHVIGGRPILTSEGADPSAIPPGLMYFPVGNITGLHSIITPLIRGQRGMLMDRFNLEEWHDHLVRYRPAASGLPPAGVQMAIEADFPLEDFASLKMLGTGAAPLDPHVQQTFEEKYGVPIILAYGATEFGGPVAGMTPQLHAQWGKQKLGSVGPAMPGASLRVVDADSGEVLPAGEQGILEVISPRIGPDWIRTSDIALIDEDGFLFLCGRADGAIIRGGFKILPETIEKALLLHPAVSAAGVVGVADPRLGQVPAAAVQAAPGHAAIDFGELEQHLRERLPSTHIPVHWLQVGALPRTLSYKVDQRALRRLFAD